VRKVERKRGKERKRKKRKAIAQYPGSFPVLSFLTACAPLGRADKLKKGRKGEEGEEKKRLNRLSVTLIPSLLFVTRFYNGGGGGEERRKREKEGGREKYLSQHNNLLVVTIYILFIVARPSWLRKMRGADSGRTGSQERDR